jgi:hypothetical protein
VEEEKEEEEEEEEEAGWCRRSPAKKRYGVRGTARPRRPETVVDASPHHSSICKTSIEKRKRFRCDAHLSSPVARGKCQGTGAGTSAT